MAKQAAPSKELIHAKKQLGKLIAQCRGDNMSANKLAIAIGLSRSNLKYIEDGVNAPTAEVYEQIVDVLQPPPMKRKKMDDLYMTIRQTPPPDVCHALMNNRQLMELVRSVDEKIKLLNDSEAAQKLISQLWQHCKGDGQNG